MKINPKRLLIDTAKDLLRKSSDFTVKEIALRSNTNIAAVNYHFQDKNNLLDIALLEILNEFKKNIKEAFQNKFESTEAGVEMILTLAFNFYFEYKGAIKYLFLADLNQDNRLFKEFFLDKDFNILFLKKISSVTGETDPNILLYKYSIAVSSFLLPVLVEFNNDDSKISLSSLQKEENKIAFISQVKKIFQ